MYISIFKWIVIFLTKSTSILYIIIFFIIASTIHFLRFSWQFYAIKSILCNVHHGAHAQVLDYTIGTSSRSVLFRRHRPNHALFMRSVVSVSQHSVMTQEIDILEFLVRKQKARNTNVCNSKRECFRFIWGELNLWFRVIYFSICLRND